MDNVIGLREFRENLGSYEKLVRAGRSFVVVKRSRPIFTVSPVDEDGWETVIDFTKFRKGGISASALIKILEER